YRLGYFPYLDKGSLIGQSPHLSQGWINTRAKKPRLPPRLPRFRLDPVNRILIWDALDVVYHVTLGHEQFEKVRDELRNLVIEGMKDELWEPGLDVIGLQEWAVAEALAAIDTLPIAGAGERQLRDAAKQAIDACEWVRRPRLEVTRNSEWQALKSAVQALGERLAPPYRDVAMLGDDVGNVLTWSGPSVQRKRSEPYLLDDSDDDESVSDPEAQARTEKYLKLLDESVAKHMPVIARLQSNSRFLAEQSALFVGLDLNELEHFYNADEHSWHYCIGAKVRVWK